MCGGGGGGGESRGSRGRGRCWASLKLNPKFEKLSSPSCYVKRRHHLWDLVIVEHNYESRKKKKLDQGPALQSTSETFLYYVVGPGNKAFVFFC